MTNAMLYTGNWSCTSLVGEFRISTGWTVRESNPGGGRRTTVQTDLVPTQPSIQQVPCLFPGG